MIYLIRHAEKSVINEQFLTKQGLIDAYNYGEKLRLQGIQFDEIISSPVTRCIQTAQEIIKGMQSNLMIKRSHLLGDPGIFVKNAQKAAQIFEQFSVYDVINKLIQKEKLPGFFLIQEACSPLIEEIYIKLSLSKSVLYISHDAIIMPFIAFINQIIQIKESDIVNFLEGYRIKKMHNHLGKNQHVMKLICSSII